MKCRLGNITVDNLTMAEAVSEIVSMANKTDGPKTVWTANLDHLARAHRDQNFRDIYDKADLVIADGMPLIWLSRLGANPLKERIAGSDLFWELGRASHTSGVRLFYLGGQPGAAAEAEAAVRKRFPNAQIVGAFCPPYGPQVSPEDFAKVQNELNKAPCDILLVGLGSPKQEKWIDRYKDALGIPVLIGVGASFDMAAGRVRRAPPYVQHAGMEWFFRFLQEPTRLWHRYFQTDLLFLIFLGFKMLVAGEWAAPRRKG